MLQFKRFQPAEYNENVILILRGRNKFLKICVENVETKTCFPLYNVKANQVQISICGDHSLFLKKLNEQKENEKQFKVRVIPDHIRSFITLVKDNTEIVSEYENPSDDEIRSFVL